MPRNSVYPALWNSKECTCVCTEEAVYTDPSLYASPAS